MTYTQMLFALTFDKLVFGHSPDLMSIAGSTLILGSAVYVATMVSNGKTSRKDQPESSAAQGDDVESGQGLLSGLTDVRSSEDHDRLPEPVEAVQMRILR